MKYLLSLLLLSVAMQAQSFTASSSALPDAPSQQPFLTVENKVNFSILAGLVAADAVTTQRGLNQGLREVNPIMRPFVTRGAAGQAAGSALGFGAGVGAALPPRYNSILEGESFVDNSENSRALPRISIP